MTNDEGCVLDRETLVEGYLLGRVPRQQLLAVIGAEELEAIEHQRDALRQDMMWGRNEGASEISYARCRQTRR